VNETGQPQPPASFGAAHTRARQTLARTARVFRSIAATARKAGDLERAAQLEHLADEAARRHAEAENAPLPPTPVLLVDDHELAREALRSVLTPAHGFLVVGEAADGQAALRVARQLRPVLVLMDVRLPGLDGLAATRALLGELPETTVVVLSSFDQRALVLEALRAGAAAYLLKGASKQEVLDTLRAALAGEHRVQGSLAANLLEEEAAVSASGPSPGPLARLSDRELEVVRLMAAGQSNTQIAQTLQVSLNTVKTHVLHVLRKLDAPDRAAAVAHAAALGLLSQPHVAPR
jgi:DNA-binding NarL/FixJ family response regulator